MKTTTILILIFTTLSALIGLSSANSQWTPGGRRKYIEELLPTQSCYVTEVLYCSLNLLIRKPNKDVP